MISLTSVISAELSIFIYTDIGGRCHGCSLLAQAFTNGIGFNAREAFYSFNEDEVLKTIHLSFFR